MKFVRNNIEMVVSSQNGPPVKYTTSPANQFVTLSTQMLLDGSPVEKHPDMLIVKPRTPLGAGFYRLSVFDTAYSLVCGIDSKVQPDALPDAVKVDKWYKTISDKNGFSWDGFMAVTQKGLGEERTLHDRGIAEAGFRDLAEQRKLTDALEKALHDLTNAKQLKQLALFCDAVAEYDPSLFSTARAGTLSVAKSVLKEHADSGDWAFVANLYQLLVTNKVTDADLNGSYGDSMKQLAEMESKSATDLRNMLNDDPDSGKQIGEYRCVKKEFLSDPVPYRVILKSTGLMTLGSPPDSFRMNAIRCLSKEGTDLRIACDRNQSTSCYLQFASKQDRDKCYDDILAARKQWAVAHAKQFTREIPVSPDYWSAKIPTCRTQYILTNPSGGVPVDFLPGGGEANVMNGEGYVQTLKPGETRNIKFITKCEWIQFKASAETTNTLQLIFCPFSDDSNDAQAYSM